MRPISADGDSPIAPRRALQASAHGQGSGPGLAALRAGGAPPTPPSEDSASQVVDPHLRDRFAQVFNAFGFFAGQAPAALDKPAGTSIGNLQSASPADASATDPPPLAAPGRPRSLEGPDMERLANDCGAVASLAAMDGGWPDPDTHGSASGNGPAPAPARDTAAPASAPAGLKAPPSFPAIAAGREAAPATVDPDASRGSPDAGTFAEYGADLSDRFTFTVTGKVVDLSARLGNLSPDEEGRLLEALSALAESHGLSLGSALVNGRALPRTASEGGM